MNYICGTCGRYDSDTLFCEIHPEWGELVEEETCDDWEADEEELEAQKIDAAEKETHRKEVED